MIRSLFAYSLIGISMLAGACSSGKPSSSVAAPAPVFPIPSENQLKYHNMEMNAFIHFTTNTFTDLEWGYGDESPGIFNPTALDVGQWVRTLKDAGFQGIILTTKHHDGFCLWPSAFTEHSVKNSPWKNGKGDLVKELSDECRKEGIKFGIYVSPWDRNHAAYGDTAYITYYRNQLHELLTQYGPVFEMWFDGANGGDGYYGGARETRKINGSTYYHWPVTIAGAKALQPDMLFFSDAGPDLRWVGNERGIAGEENWNTINNDTLFAGKAGIEKLLGTGSEDGNKWIPAEVDVSIRPGWFYHQKEDSLVKSPQKLFDIYLTSVGRGSTLLLNVPPDRRGLIHENDVKSLQGFRAILDSVFKTDLAKNAQVSSSVYRGNAREYSAAMVNDGNQQSYWATDDGVTTGTIEIDLEEDKSVRYILIQEYIALGQRVKSFSVEALINGSWKEVASGTTIGYKRILDISPSETSKLRINIRDAKASPLISTVQVF